MLSLHSISRSSCSLLLLLCVACGGGSEDSSTAGSTPEETLTETEAEAVAAAHGEPKKLFAGEVRLTGALANAKEGVVWLYVRLTGTRSPLLIRKYAMDDSAFFGDGEDRVLAFELRNTDSMMPGLPVSLPEGLELKIEYDPDGMVETKEGTEAVVLEVEVGTFDIITSLMPGMERPVEAVSNFPTVVGEAPKSDSPAKDEK